MPVGTTQLKAVREALQGRTGESAPTKKKSAKLLSAVRRESQR